MAASPIETRRSCAFWRSFQSSSESCWMREGISVAGFVAGGSCAPPVEEQAVRRYRRAPARPAVPVEPRPEFAADADWRTPTIDASEVNTQ